MSNQRFSQIFQNILTNDEKEYDKMCKKIENHIYDSSKIMKNKPP